MDIKSLFHFDDMVTPKVVTFVYWIMLLAIVIMGLVQVVAAFGMMRYQTAAGIGILVLVPIGVVLGALVARIYCELIIVLFKIYETLKDLRDKAS